MLFKYSICEFLIAIYQFHFRPLYISHINKLLSGFVFQLFQLINCFLNSK